MWNHTVFPARLGSRDTRHLRALHDVASSKSHSFLWLSNIPHYVDISHVILQLEDICLGLQFLVVVRGVAINIRTRLCV